MLKEEFSSIIDLLEAFPDEQSCIDHLELLRWNGNVVSPFSSTSKVYKCKGNNYRCRETGKYFNVRTDTLFDSTKIELRKWFIAIYIITSHKKGISSVQLSKDLGVTQKTGWLMLHKIRHCFGIHNSGELEGDVEIDETYVGGKNKNRHYDKKVKNSQGRSYKDKTPVIGMLERGGRLVAKKIDDVTAPTLTLEVMKVIKPEANIHTDEWQGYRYVGNNYNHSIVKHGCGEYVSGNTHTNTIEGFWSILKRGIIGIYHVVSRKHLQKYVDEFVFRYNTRKMFILDRFNLVLLNMNYNITYKELTNG